MAACALDDVVLRENLRQLIIANNIQVVVETGVNEGLSTYEFSKMAPFVFGIENSLTRMTGALLTLATNGAHNAGILCGNSPVVLRNLMPLLPDNTLYFLDAHWEDYLPLPDEIRAIRPGTGIIVIHDFTVPGHPEWDCPVRCNGRDIFLSHDYLREVLNEWSPTHVLHYNDRVEGTNFLRGVAYIFPH